MLFVQILCFDQQKIYKEPMDYKNSLYKRQMLICFDFQYEFMQAIMMTVHLFYRISIQNTVRVPSIKIAEQIKYLHLAVK